MASIARRSPKLPPAHSPQDVRDAVATLEDRPRAPEKTPVSSNADGYEGEFCSDGDYFYVFRGGQWKRAALSTF
ncbi:MAG TPA: hypothetical protein VEA80_04860 [Vitreimonas sp.]|uniref:hypothetical protein n=1 Tax=Vitreimonas sp. TaxID=3069702 RepID=UPI002D27D4F3|nr:hypothetical protein [Vitreimonas sp.]HYD86782.1 hypothetical protein [Vitreimonas sp.]